VPLMRLAADAAFTAGRRPAGLQMLLEAHQRAPQDADLLLELGKTLVEVEDYRAAQQAFKRLLGLVPGHAEARALLDGLVAMEGLAPRGG
jgi:Flp pilus assembly protein TadD